MLVALSLAIQLAPYNYTPTRYDMGVRLQAVDQAWLKAKPEQKKAAIPKMQQAVTLFFGGNIAGVCQALDEALAVVSKLDLDPAWAITWRPTKMVFEAGDELSVTGEWAYKPKGELPHGFEFGKVARASRAFKFENMVSNGTWMPWGRQTIHHFGLGKWEDGQAWLALANDPTEIALAERMKDIVSGKVQKSSAVNLHGYYEAVRSIRTSGLAATTEIPFVKHEGTEFRVAFPKKVGSSPDVMIALHGAGGEADMFFDSYGAGIWPRTAVANGFIFASPATSAVAPQAVLNWLTAVRKVTPGRVFLVGHSMGGGAAIGALAKLKSKPAGLVLLAPAAGSLPASAKDIPTFLAVGDQEMMMLRGVADRLEKSVVATPQGKSLLVPNAEHLMVVADAAAPAFEWIKGLR